MHEGEGGVGGRRVEEMTISDMKCKCHLTKEVASDAQPGFNMFRIMDFKNNVYIFRKTLGGLGRREQSDINKIHCD